VKVLTAGMGADLRRIRVELSSSTDLFFHYSYTAEEGEFAMLPEAQKLLVDFPDFPNSLMRMLTACVVSPSTHLAVLVVSRRSGAKGATRLEFFELSHEVKFAELLSLRFEVTAAEVANKHISYRFNAMKSKLALTEQRLLEINTLVKTKNPALLQHLQRTPTTKK